MSDPRTTIGTGRCVCRGCDRAFSGVSAFDKHQTGAKDGSNVCHDPATRGLVFDGRYWGWPSPESGSKPWGNLQDASEAVDVADEALARQGVLL